LPKKENGREIVYTIIEEKVKGYTSKVEGDTDKGFEVINTIIPPETPPVIPPEKPPIIPPETPPVAPPEKPPVTPPEKPSPKSKQPDTGDGKILGMCAGTIIISALGIGLAVARKRKNK
ncbi:MAG: Cna B-type domain-containing protein, partial [Clostridiales bacterium]|nr:Cna B-type domain-containing protein [Clostridiales bacterium]